ncbi:MAG: hypothetical protein IKD18_04980 [Clostridia bacterium]|nr:hypothetical protein [Clostridia bacterium]
MKMNFGKRISFALLALFVALSCAACKGKEEPDPTKENTAQTKEETSTVIPVSTEEEDEFIDAIPDEELLGKIGAWRGMSDSGTLDERDQYKMVTIDEAKDLDPYRAYMSNFTAEDEKTILEDTAGTCILIELSAPNDNTLYGTSSIMQGGSVISIVISTDEVEDVIPRYTFFLLYFPEAYYHGESINISF